MADVTLQLDIDKHIFNGLTKRGGRPILTEYNWVIDTLTSYQQLANEYDGNLTEQTQGNID